MSKINVCKICVNKGICVIREDCIYWRAINEVNAIREIERLKNIIDELEEYKDKREEEDYQDYLWEEER